MANTTEKPFVSVIDRHINLCATLKNRKAFPKTKHHLRSRINFPLSCPLKAGLLEFQTEFRANDVKEIFDSLMELKKLTPTVNFKNFNNRLDLSAIFYTKIKSIAVPLVNITIKDERSWIFNLRL